MDAELSNEEVEYKRSKSPYIPKTPWCPGKLIYGPSDHDHARGKRAPRYQVVIEQPDDGGDQERVEAAKRDAKWIQEAQDRLTDALREISKESSASDGILQLIPVSEIGRLREQFLSAIDRDKFTEMIMGFLGERVLKHSSEKFRALSGLLFDCIDTDGSGTISWHEFSSYLIFEYGDSFHTFNHQNAEAPDSKCYVPNCDPIPKGHLKYCHVHCCEQLDKFCFVEEPRFYSKQSLLYMLGAADLDSRLNVATIRGEHKEQYVTMEWVPWLRWLACSVVGHHEYGLLFYEVRKQDRDEDMPVVRQWYVPEQHDVLRADADLQGIFASGRRGNLVGYRLRDDDTPTRVPDTIYQGNPHASALTDMVILPLANPKTIVSCSLDATVKVQDVGYGKSVQELGANNPPDRRHRQGILSVAYSEDRNIVCTGGFEREVILWVPMEVNDSFVGRLIDAESPHKERIVSVVCPAGSNNVISTDQAGVVKIWDIRTSGLIESFHIDGSLTKSEQTRFQTVAQAYDHPRQKMVIVGRNLMDMTCKVYSFQSLKRRHTDPSLAHDGSITAAIYNPLQRSFLTASGTDLKVWDAVSGCVSQDMPRFAESHITALCLDVTCRRFVMGTHMGRLSMHNCITGVESYRYDDVPCEISSVCYLGHVRYILAACTDNHLRLYGDDGTRRAACLTIRHDTGFTKVMYSARLAIALVADDQDTVQVHGVHYKQLLHLRAECPTGKMSLHSARKLHADANGQGPRRRSAAVPRAPSGYGNTLNLSPGALRRRSSANVSTAPSEISATPENRMKAYFKGKSSGEVLSVAFTLPYAAFIIGDTNSYLTLWPLRGPHAHKPMIQWKMPKSPNDTDGHATAMAMDWLLDGTSLCAGDEYGRLTLFSVAEELECVQVPMVGGDGRDVSRNARATTLGHVDLFRRNNLLAPKVQRVWQAHQALVTVVQVCEGGGEVVSAAMDGSVRLWSPTGVPLGRLQQGLYRPPGLLAADIRESADWKFGTPSVPGCDPPPGRVPVSEPPAPDPPSPASPVSPQRPEMPLAGGESSDGSDDTESDEAAGDFCVSLPPVSPTDTEDEDDGVAGLLASLTLPMPKFKTPMCKETVHINAHAGKTTRLDILPDTGDRYFQPAGPKYVSNLAAARTAIMDDRNEMKSLLKSVLKTAEHQTPDDKARVASYKPYGPVWSAHVRKLKKERAMPVGRKETSPLYRYYHQTPPRPRSPALRGKRGHSCPPYAGPSPEVYRLTEPHTHHVKNVQRPKSSCMRGLIDSPTSSSKGSLPQLSGGPITEHQRNSRAATPFNDAEQRSFRSLASFTSALPENLGHS